MVRILALLAAVFCGCSTLLLAQQVSYDSLARSLTRTSGFIDYFYDEAKDRILLDVPTQLGEFIYVNSLAAGVGSNDLGLDRGQLGDTRLVEFKRAGNKLLLVQPNLDYRATSDNPAERRSVAEAFASSVLAGFPIVASGSTSHLIDLTPFLLRDAHGVADRLADRKQGSYKVDPLRSALYLERTRNFPRNTEFEAIVTLAGKAEGSELRSVTPTPDAVTTRQHHSFVALPEPGYQPRRFHPNSGYFPLQFADYAQPIDQPLQQRYIYRHRLTTAGTTTTGTPQEITYYVDAGAPEPVRTALIEGASWWDQAFQAAGYPAQTFRVEVLPEGADPLDVRYNVIQWVHRSTRGWSYGGSVADPRTGEILKGHVSLGSLRVRQDFLIAQGLLAAYERGGKADEALLEFALARLRQLSAHEVGHTLGLAHNFAASTRDRASVMDYPHPYVRLDDDGRVDLREAYAVGIGSWDKQTIKYGYGQAKAGTEDSYLAGILAENKALAIPFITDRDARAVGGAHPAAHLWDNGTDAAAELRRITALREKALEALGPNNLPEGRPLGELENVLAPLYLMHRYQVEATAKLLGGVQYAYAQVGDHAAPVQPIATAQQQGAIDALAATLSPEFLKLPQQLLEQLPPQPFGYQRDRELFDTRTGLTFDAQAAAEASIDHTLRYVLHPQRISRIMQQDREVGRVLAKALLKNRAASEDDRALQRLVYARSFEHALQLASHADAALDARAWGLELARQLIDATRGLGGDRSNLAAKFLAARYGQWERDPNSFTPTEAARIPDGSPIGCGGLH